MCYTEPDEVCARIVESEKLLVLTKMNSFITMPSCMDCHHYGEKKRWDASVKSGMSALCMLE